MNILADNKKNLIILAACIILTYIITASHYQNKIKDLNSEILRLEAICNDTVRAKEQALIDTALAEKKAKTPIKEYVKGDTITQIEYVEKESSSDADVEIINKAKPVTVSYNGKKEELPTTTTEGKTIENGKTVITQQTSTTIDIDAIVKREIANRILDDEKEKAVLKRQKVQQTVWGTVAGVVIGKYVLK